MDATMFSLFCHPKLSQPTSLLLRENLCRSLSSAYCNVLSYQSTKSTMRAQVSRTSSPSPCKSVVGRAFQGDDYSVSTSSDSPATKRAKLIALFRRIQTSISQEESGTRNENSHQDYDDGSSVETSVLEFLQQSTRETKVKSSKVNQSVESTRKRSIPKTEKPTPDSQPPSSHNLNRPPSNFVKKSPIPPPVPPDSNDLDVIYGELSSSENLNVPQKLEGMKLSELKELAKERGNRGYSKLKKSELVELLRSQENA